MTSTAWALTCASCQSAGMTGCLQQRALHNSRVQC